MTQGQPDPNLISPQFRRGLALLWIGIVVVVGACIFLAMWWNVNGSRSGLTTTPVTVPPSTSAPLANNRLPTQQLTPTPASTTTGPLAVSSQTAVPTPTLLPIMDRSFGYGIVVDASYNTAQTLDQVQQLGLAWIRQPVRWADVEPEPGQFEWADLDVVFTSATARNLKVLVTVSAAPTWARSVTAADMDGPPDDEQAYVNFITLLVQRYRGAIQAIEVWNEMNRDHEWYVAGGLSSTAYMELLIPTAQAIQQLDPGIIVISGGLNPTGIDDGVMAIDDFRYLREMITSGLLDTVDCVGVHHPGYNLPPNQSYDAEFDDPAIAYRQPIENPHHSWSFYSTLRGYHDMIVAAGRETPLCVTDFGWASSGSLPDQPVARFVYDNTPQEQADYIVQAFDLMHDWGFVWLAILSNLDYSPAAVASADDNLTAFYRITLPDGLPRPAFEALQAMPKRP